MKEIIETSDYLNRSAVRNNRIAAGILFFLQVFFIVFYSVFIMPTSSIPTFNDNQLFISTGVALLVLIGFGLIFGKIKNNMWSGIGFTFLIVIVSYQLYFLTAGFWNMVSISGNKLLDWKSRIRVHLTGLNGISIPGITTVGALKCGLANAIAFAGIQGRAGMLQAVIISFFGTIFYELNRQVVSKYALDNGGSMTIFCFGGFLGATISMMLNCCRQYKTVTQHEFRVSGKFSMTISGIGAMFCWVFFPCLNMQFSSSSVYHMLGGINTIYCISTCVLSSLSISLIINGRLDYRDLVYSPVIGGVIIGSSAYLITNTVGAMIMGLGGAILNFLFRLIEYKFKWALLVEHHVLYVYALTGMVGGMVSSVFVSINQDKSNYYPNIIAPGYQVAGTFISVALAIGIGLSVSVIFLIINNDDKNDHYHDRAYWIVEQDCVSLTMDFNRESDHIKLQQQDILDEQQLTRNEVQWVEVVLQKDSLVTDPYMFI